MDFKFKIQHSYKIPSSVINRAINNINANKITFGVHSEDNDKHPNRDRVQNQQLHKLLYNNGNTPTPISNSKLLAKSESGFSSTMYYGNKAHSVEVPSRPVLFPILSLTLTYNGNIIRNGIKRQFKFNNPQEFTNSLTRFSNKMGYKSVLDFIKGRGFGFWGDAEYNNPYTQAIKFLDCLEDFKLEYRDVLSKNEKFIKVISNWDVNKGSIFSKASYPLLDSLDLINSIKSKVEKQ